jgi:hypothetical protein
MDDDQQPTQAAIEQLAKFLLDVSAAHKASDGNIPVVVFVRDELVMELPVDANHTSEAERINITC